MVTSLDLKNAEVYEGVKQIVLNQFWTTSRFLQAKAGSLRFEKDPFRYMKIAQHISMLSNHMECFQSLLTGPMDIDWQSIDHSRYQFRILEKRYSWLSDQTDSLEMLFGLNVFAHGVIGVTEFTSLHQCSPDLFPDYLIFAAEEDKKWREGEQDIRKLLEAGRFSEKDLASLMDKYNSVLQETKDSSSFMKFLNNLTQIGLIPADVVSTVFSRRDEVFESLQTNLL